VWVSRLSASNGCCEETTFGMMVVMMIMVSMSVTIMHDISID